MSPRTNQEFVIECRKLLSVLGAGRPTKSVGVKGWLGTGDWVGWCVLVLDHWLIEKEDEDEDEEDFNDKAFTPFHSWLGQAIGQDECSCIP